MDYEIIELFRNEDYIQKTIEIFSGMEGKLYHGKDIIAKFASFGIESDYSESVLYILMDNGTIKVIKPGKRISSYLFISCDNLIDYLKEQKKAAKIMPKKPPKRTIENFDLIVTYPNDPKFERVKGLKLLFPNLKRLLHEAKKIINIINPYFDKVGTLRIIDDLIFSAKKSVRTRIVTREYGKNTQLTGCINTIINRFKEEGLEDFIEIRDYYKKEEKQVFAVHSKIIIIDSNKCYIGSANLTMNSFYSNLELGVVIKGKEVLTINELFKNLWTIAKRIH